MSKPLLAIGDIELRVLKLEDASELFQLIDKNRARLGKWLTWVNKTKSVDDVKKMIKKWNDRRRNGTGLNFGIVYQKKLIGYISFANVHREFKKGRIAYWLDSDFVGKGIITKSCRHLLEYGFNTLNLQRIEISCAEGNDKSKGVPERLGFNKKEVLQKSELLGDGTLVDNHIYELLRDDWSDK